MPGAHAQTIGALQKPKVWSFLFCAAWPTRVHSLLHRTRPLWQHRRCGSVMKHAMVLIALRYHLDKIYGFVRLLPFRSIISSVSSYQFHHVSPSFFCFSASSSFRCLCMGNSGARDCCSYCTELHFYRDEKLCPRHLE